jgi:hypothetical protein
MGPGDYLDESNRLHTRERHAQEGAGGASNDTSSNTCDIAAEWGRFQSIGADLITRSINSKCHAIFQHLAAESAVAETKIWLLTEAGHYRLLGQVEKDVLEFRTSAN